MRKAQIIGQVFIYALAAVVFGMILLFGYRAVDNFLQRSHEVSLIDLKNDMQSGINSIGSSKDVEKRVFYLPSKYTKLCFLGNVTDDNYKQTTCLCLGKPGCVGGNESDYSPALCKIWRDGTRQNVYLIPLGDIDITVKKIEMEHDYLCVTPQKGMVELRLKGKGDSTLIQKW